MVISAGERYKGTGEILPDSAIEEFKKLDSMYLGAIGHPDVKPGILEVGILLKTRFYAAVEHGFEGASLPDFVRADLEGHAVARIFADSVMGRYRRRLAPGVPVARGGVVTVIQRSSSDVKLNPHLHAIAVDGAYVPGRADSTVRNGRSAIVSVAHEWAQFRTLRHHTARPRWSATARASSASSATRTCGPGAWPGPGPAGTVLPLGHAPAPEPPGQLFE